MFEKIILAGENRKWEGKNQIGRVLIRLRFYFVLKGYKSVEKRESITARNVLLHTPVTLKGYRILLNDLILSEKKYFNASCEDQIF